MTSLSFSFFLLQASSTVLIIVSNSTPCSPRVLGGGLHPWYPKSVSALNLWWFQDEAHSEPTQLWRLWFQPSGLQSLFPVRFGSEGKVVLEQLEVWPCCSPERWPTWGWNQPHGWQSQRWWDINLVLVTSLDHKSTGFGSLFMSSFFISKNQ